MSYKLEIPNKDMHLLLLLGYFFICMRESELKEVLVLQLSKTSFFFLLIIKFLLNKGILSKKLILELRGKREW